MKYIKISPFDFYLLLDKRMAGGKLVDLREVGEVKISLSGPGVSEPYSFMHPLKELDGVAYLRCSTIPPSEEAKEYFSKEDFSPALQKLAPRADIVITYEPESD